MAREAGRLYGDRFYASQAEGSLRAARRVVPLLIESVAPARVVDVGCGVGAWLSVFREQGVERVLGLDGAHVPTARMLVPAECFRAVDLEEGVPTEERFDLAVSVEVAEHLSERAGRALVGALVRLAPVVAFSGAIPWQGGVGHVNERWPSWWRARFEEHGYVAVDWLRPRLWSDPDVVWWYAQNLLLYVERASLPRYPLLAASHASQPGPVPDLVHPELWEKRMDPRRVSTRLLLRTWLGALRHRLVGRLGGRRKGPPEA